MKKLKFQNLKYWNDYLFNRRKKEYLLTEYSNKSISKNILNSKDINF